MPVRIIGMIGVAPPGGTALHVIGGGVSPPFLGEFARMHEKAGSDLVLVGYYSSPAEGFAVAAYAASQTTTLGYLVAHRTGLVAPTLAARTIAPIDALWGGRLAVHIIAGNSDEDMERDGDFTPKHQRYERAAGSLDVMRRVSTCTEPFDYEGCFYQIAQGIPGCPADPKAVSGVAVRRLLVGSTSLGRATLRHVCHVPRAETAERMTDFRELAARFGRTEGEAWDRAHKILAKLKVAPPHPRGQDLSDKRLVDLAARGDVHDERLWRHSHY